MKMTAYIKKTQCSFVALMHLETLTHSLAPLSDLPHLEFEQNMKLLVISAALFDSYNFLSALIHQGLKIFNLSKLWQLELSICGISFLKLQHFSLRLYMSCSLFFFF